MSHPGKTEILEVDDTIKSLFEAMSIEKGSLPDLGKIKELFLKEGLLINYNEETHQVFTIQEFIDHFEHRHEPGVDKGLIYREVHHKTKIYDRIAHRYSFYEVRANPKEEPTAVGINSIQLIKAGKDWKVSSMAWNDDVRGDGFFKRTMDCVRSST